MRGSEGGGGSVVRRCAKVQAPPPCKFRSRSPQPPRPPAPPATRRTPPPPWCPHQLRGGGRPEVVTQHVGQPARHERHVPAGSVCGGGGGRRGECVGGGGGGRGGHRLGRTRRLRRTSAYATAPHAHSAPPARHARSATQRSTEQRSAHAGVLPVVQVLRVELAAGQVQWPAASRRGGGGNRDKSLRRHAAYQPATPICQPAHPPAPDQGTQLQTAPSPLTPSTAHL